MQLITYDFYLPYINPKASEKRIVSVQHFSVAVWGLVMSVLGIGLFYAGISMG